MIANHRKLLVLVMVPVLFIIAFVYLIPGINQPVNVYDEGIVAYSAVRVMEGQVPYRDFWSIYSPAQFYGLAVAFKLFGTTINVERLWDTAMRAFVAVAAFLLVWRLSKPWAAFVVWAAVTIWVAYYTFSSQFHWVFYGYPAFPAIALCLFSILCLSIYFTNNRTAWLVAGGVILGFAALFRHDFGIYGAAGEGLTLVLYGLMRINTAPAVSERVGDKAAVVAAPLRANEPLAGMNSAKTASSPGVRDKLLSVVQVIVPWAIGTLVIMIPVVIYFVVLTPLNELVYDLLIFPIETFPRFRGLPYPAFSFPNNLAFYLPFPVYLITAVVAVVQLRRRNFAYAFSLLSLIIFGLFSFNQARVRADLIHTPAFFLPALIMITILLGGVPRREGESADAAQVLSAVALLLIVVVLAQPLGDRAALLANDKLMHPIIANDLERSQTAIVNTNMVAAVHFIDDNTSPQDKIYVGNATHDRIFINEPMFYFLAERDAATRYHELHPGVATTAPVQTEIAGDLEKYQVKYLVLTNAYERVREPNQSAISSGVKILDNYIADHYVPVMQYGPYTIWKRRKIVPR